MIMIVIVIMFVVQFMSSLYQ
uniref:Uncharacterized protein n=1 Tax=Anguilla anguilla TaxID=7936 RepID=A0A0E9TBK7_ANGAN